VVFLKDKDVVLTSDYWQIIVNFDLTPYEDATTTPREDLARVEEIARNTAPVGELRHVGTALKLFGKQVRKTKKNLEYSHLSCSLQNDLIALNATKSSRLTEKETTRSRRPTASPAGQQTRENITHNTNACGPPMSKAFITKIASPNINGIQFHTWVRVLAEFIRTHEIDIALLQVTNKQSVDINEYKLLHIST
jgi:hypothetical protein